ncbi:MAG: bifunctional 4-hydroxy-3-methylbut-2-enyl diphosphate reductase/30S ribosomal protein S1 [Tissierellia bacterium]|nr:bifunctional 4-hydroxy-3-methylbut-2-enyl diphosphate reductase/30S ribosomal protein S1 [Tissierellia bacterium]
MEIILADVLGFCNGVRRAVTLAYETASLEGEVKSFGDLVHNPRVVKDLRDQGVQPLEEGEVPQGITVISRSHGMTKTQKESFLENGNTLIDTTCPFVIRVQDIAREATEKNQEIILVGMKDHPEVQAIASYAGDNLHVVAGPKEVKKLDLDKVNEIILISQTTNKESLVKEVEDTLKEVCTGDILRYNTICRATKDRQESCARLAKKVDCMLVIGGKNSSNTKKLAQVASEHCQCVYHIETIDDIDIRHLLKFNKIGITAGASTPDMVIKEAVSRMENFNKDEMTNEMMEAIDNSFTRVRRGEILDGEVLYVTDDEVMVNIGYRADGIISREELSNDPDVKPSDLFEQGQEIQVYVMKMDDGDGNVVLSYKRVESMKVWDDMQEKYENKEKVLAHVKSVVKGGLTCEVEGLNGFIPASHVSVRFQRDLSKYVGEDLLCEIIDFDKGRRKFVLSRKNVEAVEIEEKRKEIYDNIHEGDVINGVVQRLTNFGAFVDIGGVDGLIHISELSWNRVKHPSDVVSPGEEVEVQVLNVDEDKDRIALSLKQTTEKPWDVFTRTVSVGDVVEGVLVNILDFGAFIRLESGVDGLLHVSQISKKHVDKPADVLEVGQSVTVKVTDINNEEKKISLSMRALEEDKEDDKEKAPERKEAAKPVERPRKIEKPQEEEKDPMEDQLTTTIGDLINLKGFEEELED